ncbi:hypothetical protein H8356DRAFT_1283887 [Neocallimastix lanati (nom. inval.)]|jgi:hypothetical protein|nr:hypothetical protein H8356DRAFT_1283887 [Neocallimastix sp. JGI-2020a]
MRLSKIYKDLKGKVSKSDSNLLSVKQTNYNSEPDVYLHSNFTSDNASIKVPEIIVSPPSPSPFPHVSTSHEHLASCNGSCGFAQHIAPVNGINNIPILDLEDVPAVCEHEYDEVDMLILESVFNTRNDYIRPIDSVYMNKVENKEEEPMEITTRDIDLSNLDDNKDNDDNNDNNQPSSPNKINSVSNGSDTLHNTCQIYFTKDKQTPLISDGLEDSRCCWITSTLQVLCNLPGAETSFPRYNCMLNDAQRELYKLLQIIQSDDDTLQEILKINKNDPKLLADLNDNYNDSLTVNPTSLIQTLFSSIQDPFIDYFSDIAQSSFKTSKGLYVSDNMNRCNYSSEFARILLDKILVGTRLRSRCQATIICRDMCSICKKKSQKSVMKYCRFFPLLLTKEIKEKNKYEISFIDIMREELNHLPVFIDESLKNKESQNKETMNTDTDSKENEIPFITLNSDDTNISRPQESNDDEIILSDYVFPTIFSNQKTDFNCNCKSCVDNDGVHRHIVRYTSFVHLPEILVFSIVRDGTTTMEISFNPIRRERCMKRSLNRPIRIPMEIDMGAHVHPEYRNESNSTFYKLHGFVTQKDGRYIAYTHISNSFQWYKIDDSKIIPIDLLVGSFPTEGVSLLFYVLQVKKHF